MSEPQVKGQRFLRIAEMVKELAPAERFQQMLDVLSPATRELLVYAPPATAWLPIAPLDELLRLALRIGYQNDLALVFEQGRRSFIRDVKNVYKIFIRLSSPEYIIRRAGQIYGTYYRDNGSISIVEQAPKLLRIDYSDVVLGSPAFWEQSRGTLHGALEATGMKNVKAEVVEGGGEAKHCHYRVVWS